MKKKHKSIFGKLIFSYFVFTAVAIVGVVVCFVLALVQSVGGEQKLEEYPYIVFAQNGELKSSEALEQFAGWVEELDEDYSVSKVFGQKRTEIQQYTEKEIIGYLSKALQMNHEGEYYILYHEEGGYRYLLYYPENLFHLIYNINSEGMVYTNFNKGILIVLVLFLGLEVLGVSLFISKKITKPMRAISEGMEKVAAGENKVDIPLYAEKEFVGIQNAFLKMQDELHKQKQEKEDILNRRHQMLLELSHDIKTPVATIKSYASALSENMVLAEDLQKYYATISLKADRVNNLTMDLFTMLKMESEEYQVQREKLNFSELIRTVLANLYDDITTDGFELDIDLDEEDIYTMGDENYLTRAVENLLNNARKYNTTGNQIAVKLVSLLEDRKIVLTIMDDGTAIDEHTRDTMFQAFARGEKSRKSDGGTGLGLAITRQIVEKHGGTLTYTYEEKKNCFVMKLEKV